MSRHGYDEGNLGCFLQILVAVVAITALVYIILSGVTS